MSDGSSRQEAAPWPWHGAPANPSASAAAAAPGDGGAEVAAWATREFLHAEDPERIRTVVLEAVARFGGELAEAAEDPVEALPVDVTLGLGEPLVPVAPVGGPARRLLERHLPAIVADARQALDQLARNELLRWAASMDPLTRLGNRAVLDRLLPRLTPRDVLMVFDLDGFKDVNDEHGHAEGDLVLAAFADCLRGQLRARDHGIRAGGDEFIVVLTDTDVDGARVAFDRIRTDWATQRPYPVSVSAGVAAVRSGGSGAYLAADRALYEAKALDGSGLKVADEAGAS